VCVVETNRPNDSRTFDHQSPTHFSRTQATTTITTTTLTNRVFLGENSIMKVGSMIARGSPHWLVLLVLLVLANTKNGSAFVPQRNMMMMMPLTTITTSSTSNLHPPPSSGERLGMAHRKTSSCEAESSSSSSTSLVPPPTTPPHFWSKVGTMAAISLALWAGPTTLVASTINIGASVDQQQQQHQGNTASLQQYFSASAKEMASGSGSRVNKDAESLLRYSLPIKNKEVRKYFQTPNVF
jgi:hypothetical protein